MVGGWFTRLTDIIGTHVRGEETIYGGYTQLKTSRPVLCGC